MSQFECILEQVNKIKESIVVVQSLRHVWICDPWILADQASLPSLSPRVRSNSYPLNWWCNPTISSSFSPSPFAFNLSEHQGFSNELDLPFSWPKYWSFNFSISSSSEYSELIYFFDAQPSLWSNSHNNTVHDDWKNYSFDYMHVCQQSDVSAFQYTVSNTWTVKFQIFKLVLEMAEEPEIKLPTSTGSSNMQESSRKTSISALLTMPKPLSVWITTNCGKFFKRWEY